MQHIKNFRLAAPQPFQLLRYPGINAFEYNFYISEDGQDWYQCQEKFRDDTVKIAYDSDGVIVSLVDRPVPERGFTFAISKLNPRDASVVEIELKDFPEGVKDNGEWFYINGIIIHIPKSEQKQSEVVAPKTNSVVSSTEKTNKDIYIELLQEAMQMLVIFQCAVNENKGDSEYEVCMIGKLQKYILQLVETDLQTNPVKWPTKDWPKWE